MPPLVSPSLPPTVHTFPPSRPPLSNGVGVPGLGPVYPSGKMAAFRSLCDTDTDLDTDGEEAPLVILEQVEPSKRSREEEEVQQIKVVNHIKSGIIQEDLACLSNSQVAEMEATSRDNVNNMQTEVVLKTAANGDNGVCDGPVSPLSASPPPSPDLTCDLPSSPPLQSIRLRNNNVRQLIYKE